MNLWETEMLRATGYILKNFLQDFKHEKFPATGRSHGRVGFHALAEIWKGKPGSSESIYKCLQVWSLGVYRIAFYKIRPEPDLPDFLHWNSAG